MFFRLLPRQPVARARSPLAFFSLAALLIAGFAAAAWAVDPTTVLVSRAFDDSSMVPKAYARDAVVSANGNRVAFVSNATNFAYVTPNTTNIFSKNIATGSLELVSVGVDGAPANASSVNPSTSADGRFVAFESFASNLVAGDTNGQRDIYVRDLSTGTTRRASLRAGGTQTGAACYDPAISADGRYVAFASLGSNLVAGDTNGNTDIFIRDLTANTTTRASLGSGGEQGNSASVSASFSADGRYLAFTSLASNLVADDTNDRYDVFVRDLVSGTITRVSVGPGGAQANDNSGISPTSGGDLSISADGRYVAFSSKATNLVSSDTNGTWDIFVRDHVTGTTTRASLDSSGTQASVDCRIPLISADGRFVAF